ncbi:MAG: ABC transporter permease [Anaerolineae bacterium]|nr:ABC transporter permease [Anaerolineae bacterium]
MPTGKPVQPLQNAGSVPVLVRKWLAGWAHRRWVDYAFVVGLVILAIVVASATDVFFTQRNISNLFRQIVTNGLVSLGMLVVILTGGIDLSVGPIVALTGILAAGLTDRIGLAPALLVALLVGLVAGALNGFLIARFKLPPFIVTLATLSAFRGLIYVYSETPQTPQNPAFRSLLGGGFVGPIPVAVIVMLICYPLVWIFLNRTTVGRAIVALGGNEEAVRLAGINVRRHIVLAYIISGFFSAIAGILLASRLGIAQPNVGSGYELDAIAAVVIGGGVLGGGGGGVVGTFGGVLVLGVIDNLLNLFNVQSYYQQILKGLIIVFAVLARRREQ